MKAAEAMARGLAERARNLLRALDRQDRLEGSREFAGWLERAVAGDDMPAIAGELLLRALRTAGDPTNFRILELLGPLEGVRLAEVMERTGLTRVAASERVNDLVQVGLASRELIDDQIRGTPLASGIVRLVGELSAEAGRRLAEELGAAAADTRGGRG